MPRLALPVINPDRCTGCGRCVAACPEHVLWLQAERPNGMGDKHAMLHDDTGLHWLRQMRRHLPFRCHRHGPYQ
jgi:ferredoxin